MEQSEKQIGAIEWRDLTVDNAESLKGFYESVVGWKSGAVSMGDYQDYTMDLPGSGETVAGVCHARGCNAGLPPQWLMYVRVKSVHDSIAASEKLGGKLLYGPKGMGDDEFCVVQDPAGAVIGLISEVIKT